MAQYRLERWVFGECKRVVMVDTWLEMLGQYMAWDDDSCAIRVLWGREFDEEVPSDLIAGGVMTLKELNR